MGIFKLHIENRSHILHGPMNLPIGLFKINIENYSHIFQGALS